MLPFRPQHSLDYVDEADQSFVARPLPPFPTGGFGMGLSEYGRPASYPFDDPVHFYYQQQHQYVKPVAPLSQGPTTAPIRTESQLFSELAAMAYTPQVRGGGGGGWGNRMRYPVDQMYVAGPFIPFCFRQFKLEVAQQPLRARMCGFGDKDRRPITPPPILQLKVYDRSGYALDVKYVRSPLVCGQVLQVVRGISLCGAPPHVCVICFQGASSQLQIAVSHGIHAILQKR
ncbi:velvet factor-domain-containing protein [Jimgerdemannia flammicorona]|uniref:Velvet factor-domain-containing protein n=1 Tax=Jimgerdemannia flammicorona TaxID=994334 RepID=A0A433CW83_9FUNG|nr:velvet factor-domain-containing protein [Jimgerdemannia flammicorona]